MLKGIGKRIVMTEKDYGLDLPIRIIGATFDASDKIKMIIKDRTNGTTILEKEFGNITDNTINFNLTEEESLLFRPTNYVYSLDWYRNGEFLCNIVPNGAFEVGDKC